MKKKKLNGDVVKQFFIAHGEKLAAAFGVLMTGILVYSALGVALYPKKPEDLARDTKTARSRIDQSKLDLDQAGIKLPTDKFTDTIDRELLKPLDPAKFATTEWNKPLFEMKQRRREPTYLAVRDLRCTYHFAPVNFKVAEGSGNSAGRPLGKEWITVLGLVPVEEQTANYRKAFHNALDITTNASPKYLVYQICRAEVNTLDPDEAVQWDKITPIDLQVAINGTAAEWNGFGVETAHPDTVRLPLTEPLPPLPNGDYGAWSLHPEIPPVPPKADNAPAPVAAERPVTNILEPAAEDKNKPAAPIVNAAGQPEAAKAAVKNLLFRFIDFNVAPGKRYRYRVKLILSNPNFGLDAAHLEKPTLATGDTREAPWSKDSPSIGIPFHDQYFAGSVKTLGSDAEPTVAAAVKKWMPEFGAMGLVEFNDYLRGGLLTSGATTVLYTAPGGQSVGKSAQLYNSGATLLDFACEKTSDKLRGPNDRTVAKPSEVLLVNDRGELKICLQMMDGDFWKEIKSLKAGTVPVLPNHAANAPSGAVAPVVSGGATNPVTPGTVAAPGTTVTPPTATPAGTPPASGDLPPNDPRKILKLK